MSGLCTANRPHSPRANRPPRPIPAAGSSRPTNCRWIRWGRITAHITRGNVQDIILDLCDQLRLNYYFKSPVSLTTGIWVDDTDFETLLAVLLKGSQYSYYCERGIYVFGAAQGDGLASVTVVPLAFRAVSKLEDAIPAALKSGVEIKTFPDLNSLILSGDRRDVVRVETFVKSVDQGGAAHHDGDHHRRCAAEQHP